MNSYSSGSTALVILTLWSTAIFGAAPQVRPIFEDFSWKLEAPQDLQIEADKMDTTEDGDHIHLTGNVHVTGKNIDIRSDEADLLQKEEHAVFIGNVRAADGKRMLLGDRLELDRQTSQILIKHAVILLKKDRFSLEAAPCANAAECESRGLNNLSIRGDNILRQNDHYKIDHAHFTTCDCSGATPTWEIRSSSADALPNERVWMMWPIFYAKGLPIFALPAIYFPLSERRTGLLFPLINFSGRDGVVLSESLFVTLGQSADTTFSLDWIQDRGFRERLEFRVRPSVTSGVEVRLGVSQDHKARFLEKDGTTKPNLVRTSGELNAYADFSEQTALRAAVRLYSDSDLYHDFRSDMAGRAAEQAPSQFALWRRSMDQLWAFDATYNQDLRFGMENLFSDRTYYTIKPSDTIHRLGAFSFALAPISLPEVPLRFSLELEAVNYSSFGRSWQDWGKDGMPASQLPLPNQDQYSKYDGEGHGLSAGELRRAVRFMVKPIIDIPIRLDRFLELEGTVSHRQFVYIPHGTDAPEAFTRGLSYASVRAFSELSRSFGDQGDIGNVISPVIQVAGAWPGLSTVKDAQFFDWQDRLQQHAVQLIGGIENPSL